MASNIHNKIANRGYEEQSTYTTRNFSRHGVSPGFRRAKKLRNRSAKRKAERRAFRDES